MFVISTRISLPKSVECKFNGWSILSLLKHGPVKVFAEKTLGQENFDKNLGIDVTRVSGLKIFRKYRKANLIKEFSLKNSVRAFFFRSLEKYRKNR